MRGDSAVGVMIALWHGDSAVSVVTECDVVIIVTEC